MKSHNYLFIKLFFTCLAIAGCTSIPTPSETGPYDFRLEGRIGVRAKNHGDTRAFSASFVWYQYPERFDIELWGPLGQGRTRLLGDGNRMTLYSARGDRFDDADAEELMLTHLGWSAPVDALPTWVVGRPVETYPVAEREYDALGDLVSFAQLGWTVSTSRYEEIGVRRVPGKVVASNGATQITIVAREWTFE